MKMKTLLLTLSSIMAITVGGISIGQAVAAADSDEHKPGGSHGEKQPQRSPAAMLKRQLAKLDLSAEQKQAIATAMAEHRANRPDAAERQAAQQAWQALMAAPEFDAETAKVLLAERREQQQARQLHALQLRHQIMQILTQEQRQQLELQREAQREKRQGEGLRSNMMRP